MAHQLYLSNIIKLQEFFKMIYSRKQIYQSVRVGAVLLADVTRPNNRFIGLLVHPLMVID